MPRLQRGVFPGAALAVVLVADDAPRHVGGLVGARRRRDRTVFAGQLVADLVQFAVLGVCCAGRLNKNK